MDFVFGGGMTPIEPRAGNVHGFRGGVWDREAARVGVRGFRVPTGFVFGGGMTPIEPRGEIFHVFFFEEVSRQRSCES
jgi:hypothetical protein